MSQEKLNWVHHILNCLAYLIRSLKGRSNGHWPQTCTKIKECFPEIFDRTAASLCDMKRVRRTCREDELEFENWIFQVRLMHGGCNLDEK